MNFKLSFPILLLVLILLLVASCGEESTTTTPGPTANILLTLHPDEHYLDDFAPEGIAFVSDSSGNLLDMKIWTGPGTVVLSSSTVKPDTISFTIVQYTDTEVSLVTEFGVPVGSERTLAGYPPLKLAGSADVSFVNPPDLRSYRLTTPWSTDYEFLVMPEQAKVYLYGESTDYFVRVDPVGADPVGGWLRDIRPGESRVFDFLQPGLVTPMTAHSVLIPSTGEDLSYNVYGSVATEAGPYRFNFDFASVRSIFPPSIILFAPEFDSSKLGTRFTLRNNSPGPSYTQESMGPIPEAFTIMEGDLNITHASLDSTSFTTTADWDRFSTFLGQNQDLEATWHAEGPAPVQTFSMPRFPDYLTEILPGYPREGFFMYYVAIFKETPDGVVRSMSKFVPSSGADAP